MSWREEWADMIWQAVKALPDDTPLDERIKIVDRVRRAAPGMYATSWGKKTWQTARRDYLCKYGYKPKTKKKSDQITLFDLSSSTS